MALNGAAWAGYANALREFIAGDEAEELVEICSGRRVTFIHDFESEGAEVTVSGFDTTGNLVAYTKERLTVGQLFAWRGHAWQVCPHGDQPAVEFDRAAGSDWPHRVELVRQAGRPDDAR